jgi:hypothetical protein
MQRACQNHSFCKSLILCDTHNRPRQAPGVISETERANSEHRARTNFFTANLLTLKSLDLTPNSCSAVHAKRAKNDETSHALPNFVGEQRTDLSYSIPWKKT